jgi:hypothetical protein
VSQRSDLLAEFAAVYPGAANIIAESSALSKLVQVYADDGVNFGGAAEASSKAALDRSYALGMSVYVPNENGDTIMQLRDFLFECRNADQFGNVVLLAKQAKTDEITADDYALGMAKIEANSEVSTGDAWENIVTSIPGEKIQGYDSNFYALEYKSVTLGIRNIDNLAAQILSNVYASGTYAGKTVRDYYVHVYDCLLDSSSKSMSELDACYLFPIAVYYVYQKRPESAQRARRRGERIDHA